MLLKRLQGLASLLNKRRVILITGCVVILLAAGGAAWHSAAHHGSKNFTASTAGSSGDTGGISISTAPQGYTITLGDGNNNVASSDTASGSGQSPSGTGNKASSSSSPSTKSSGSTSSACSVTEQIVEANYNSAVKQADSVTDNAVQQVVNNNGGNYSPGVVAVINNIYDRGNTMLNSAWQTYTKDLNGCPADALAPVPYSHLAIPQTPPPASTAGYTYEQASAWAQQNCSVILSGVSAGSSSAMQQCISAYMHQLGY